MKRVPSIAADGAILDPASD